MIGKIGTDIEDNKCSWLICTALQKASDAQKEQIKVRGGVEWGGGPLHFVWGGSALGEAHAWLSPR